MGKQSHFQPWLIVTSILAWGPLKMMQGCELFLQFVVEVTIAAGWNKLRKHFGKGIQMNKKMVQKNSNSNWNVEMEEVMANATTC